MKNPVRCLLVLSALVIGSSVAFAGVNVGITADEDGISSFHLAIGEHFGVPEADVKVVREVRIPDDEIPVVFYIAGRAGVSHRKVMALRLKGMSWIDISYHFGLGADIFYVPLSADPGPPYGKAYGHFKKTKKSNWRKIKLVDVDIVNLVNLRFISERFGHSPDEVAKMRKNGKGFVAIHKEVHKIKAEKTEKIKNKKMAQSSDKKSKVKSSGKKTGKGKKK